MQPSISSRTDPAIEEFAADVRSGLTKPGQKELHSRYLYDGLGSALFEAITQLPEYGLTRADERILQAHAGDIADAVGGGVAVAELGSGTGRKTRSILAAIASRTSEVKYFPIDVSRSALALCAHELASAAQVIPVEATYLDGIRRVAADRDGVRLLVLFLGSTIGNFERPCAREFLSQVRALLAPGDALLVGADLVKPAAQLLAAYDDPTGVTACFNRNLLGRVNRELGANFDLRRFEHEARYNEPERRIEMYLRSAADQVVSVPRAACTVALRQGETIWTESSHKFTIEELDGMAAASAFAVRQTWVDQQWPFVETLWFAA